MRLQLRTAIGDDECSADQLSSYPLDFSDSSWWSKVDTGKHLDSSDRIYEYGAVTPL